jgi:hypothetical protein
MAGTPSRSAAIADDELDREIELIVRTLAQHGSIAYEELERLVGARGWGPGRFDSAARAAVREGRAESKPHHGYGPPSARADAAPTA